MLRFVMIGAVTGVLFPVAGLCVEQPCKPSPTQMCLDLPSGYQPSSTRKPAKPGSDQTQKSAPLPNMAHERRMKLDDDTSVGLGGRGLSIKRSF